MVNDEAMDVVVYNLALCLARQQKHEDSQAVRLSFLGRVERVEVVRGAIKQTLENDAIELIRETEKQLREETNATPGISDGPWVH